MNNVIKLLELISDGETKVRAIYNAKHHNIDKHSGEKCPEEIQGDTPTAAIANGFVWDQTSEGFEHWAKVYDEFLDKY